MNESEFSQAANDIAVFLGASAPTATKILAWMPKVERIPSEAIGYIVEKITDEADRMPANLPKAFREKFMLWLRENPEKAATEGQGGCSACESGILFLERDMGDGRKETAAVFCRCHRGSAGKVGRASLYDMQTKGWRSTKAATIGPANQAAKDKAHGHMAGAKKAESEPNPLRYDGYEDRYDEEHW